MSEALRCILIVDDSQEDRATFRRYLEKDETQSYVILEAETGTEGLALCRLHQPDCVLLDYQLPDVDGLEVLQRLTGENTGQFFAPVVMLTGQGDEIVALKAMKGGAQNYLSKGTLKCSFLQQVVAKAIEKASLLRKLDDQRRALEEANKQLINEITQTKRAEAIIRVALEEKEVLLKEIHHRVKNNLAVIGSLFHMQSTYTQDARTMRVLRDCQDRVRSMALVHERLYQSGNLARVDFPAYVEDLATQLFATYVLTPDTVCLKLELETVWMDIDRAIPCGLILNELIANALKHAFPSGRPGEVRVCVRVQEPGGLMLSVVDNGVGLPDDATLQTRRSFGMDLIQALATQLDACIEFIHHDPGTEVRLKLEEASHVHAS